ncbi:helix-turn-helix domain-containing protein [Streptomyces halobius]|uniref:Transposase n=1 Tax=Streptomyces halobius TaxID=2879846 RepID=A0ABY4M3Z2_9ACTN|nr:helix-turn-helix domain-containing protein [Streptomyces halobius]UQA91903.1 hypothetical protein K9S39_08580 [Streptomyces halobius]
MDLGIGDEDLSRDAFGELDGAVETHPGAAAPTPGVLPPMTRTSRRHRPPRRPDMGAPHSNPRPALALAGQGLPSREEMAIQRRAEVLRGVATGMTLADAARAAGVPSGTLYSWRARNQLFRAALDAVRSMVEAETERPLPSITTARAEVFLKALREGETVEQAAARAGASPWTFYRYRERKPSFAQQMKQAQKIGMQARASRRERKRAPFRAMRYRLVRRDEYGLAGPGVDQTIASSGRDGRRR